MKIHVSNYNYTVGHKKTHQNSFVYNSRNINRFSKFFHCLTQEEICYKSIYYTSHHTLNTLLHYHVNHNVGLIDMILVLEQTYC